MKKYFSTRRFLMESSVW